MGVHRAPRIPRRPQMVLLTGLLALLAVASSTPASAATGTYVRLAQLTPADPGTELVVSSVSDPRRSVTIAGVGYGSVTPYLRIDPGDYVIGRRAGGSTGLPLVGTTLTATAGSAHTLAVVDAVTATGPDRRGGLAVFTDDTSAPPPGLGKLRVIDAVAGGPLQVRAPDGATLADGLVEGTAGAYHPVAPGPSIVAVGVAGGPVTGLAVSVGVNQVVSVVLVSVSGSLQARVQVDADGPAAMPPGPVHAGYGGTADGGTADGGSGPAGTAALALLATAAATLAIRSGRRRPREARRPSC